MVLSNVFFDLKTEPDVGGDEFELGLGPCLRAKPCSTTDIHTCVVHLITILRNQLHQSFVRLRSRDFREQHRGRRARIDFAYAIAAFITTNIVIDQNLAGAFASRTTILNIQLHLGSLSYDTLFSKTITLFEMGLSWVMTAGPAFELGVRMSVAIPDYGFRP